MLLTVGKHYGCKRKAVWSKMRTAQSNLSTFFLGKNYELLLRSLHSNNAWTCMRSSQSIPMQTKRHVSSYLFHSFIFIYMHLYSFISYYFSSAVTIIFTATRCVGPVVSKKGLHILHCRVLLLGATIGNKRCWELGRTLRGFPLYQLRASVYWVTCTVRKTHTKLHPGPEWHIFHNPTSEGINDAIVRLIFG